MRSEERAHAPAVDTAGAHAAGAHALAVDRAVPDRAQPPQRGSSMNGTPAGVAAVRSHSALSTRALAPLAPEPMKDTQ